MSKSFSCSSLSMLFGLMILLGGCGGGSSNSNSNSNSNALTKIELGRVIFFDTDLSSDANQSCASCHDPASGFADADAEVTAPVSEGSVTGSFGNRNAPTAAYASFSPEFGTLVNAGIVQTGETDSKYRGGQFLDGRRSNLIEQAKDPFLNPVEMNNADAADVVGKVQNATYADDFLDIYGAGAFDNTTTAYDNIADAIAAFEASSELNPFTSKFDAFLLGKYAMTPSEARGLALFKDANGAKCANCHTLDDTGATQSFFTNFEYYNIGAPVNAGTPTSLVIDEGLGGAGATGEVAEQGKFKVPTLRNIELTAPYMHNGVHETLEEVITHYDINVANSFPPLPEVNANIATELTVPLNLQPQDATDLINFMLTLTDGHL